MQAVYINLDTRPDRREQIEAECARMGLAVERFDARRSIGPGPGCTLSHLEVLKLARSRGSPSVLIFEDDFEFLVSKETVDTLLQRLPDDYDVVMLAYHVTCEEPYSEDFGRALEAQTASGYIVHSRMYDRLIATLEDAHRLYVENPSMHWVYINDQFWKQLQPVSRWYYSRIRIGRQRAGYSDLVGEFRDYGV